MTQADDTVLVSTDLHKLKFLLDLTLQYCDKHHVVLSPTKTKLQIYCHPDFLPDRELFAATCYLSINGTPIQVVTSTEHVGVLRSPDGNLPHIMQRLTCHNRSLFSILHSGLAKGHRGNPAASLRVEQVYCVPVLLSGTASLVLKNSELSIIDSYYKKKLLQLQKLCNRTPDSVAYFLSGSLPASALLHKRQLTLFYMIARLPGNILHRIGKYVLTTFRPSSKSWFVSIRALCNLYNLPNPLQTMENPPTKEAGKSLIK